MEIRQLRYLVLLSEELHFTRAAALANVAQPALSRQIRRLEVELGVPLVDRTSRQVALTPAGARLVARAQRILDEVEVARDEALAVRRLLAGRLSIGVSTTPGGVDIAALLSAFHRAHPGVELRVRDGLSVDLAGDVLGDRLDAAFVTTDEPRLEAVTIAEEPLVALGVAGRARIALRDLADAPFVAFPRGATIRAQVERAAAASGFAPRVAFELGDVARMRAIVAAGLGVAVLPRSQAGKGATALIDPGLIHRVALARRRERAASPAARVFWDAVTGPAAPPRS